MNRREFLKTSAVVLGAAAVSEGISTAVSEKASARAQTKEQWLGGQVYLVCIYFHDMLGFYHGSPSSHTILWRRLPYYPPGQ